MTLAEVRDILGAEILHGSNLEKIEIAMGCGADLMSDVLSYRKTGGLLLTGLAHIQKSSDRFSIESAVGRGTRLRSTLFTGGEAHETG